MQLSRAFVSSVWTQAAPGPFLGLPEFCCQQIMSMASAAGLHHHPPRRAMLYVPGAMEKKICKAASEIGADSIVMDCEDGVAANMKDQARQTISLMLDDLDFGTSEAAVRINPVSSGLADDDLVAVLSAKRLPDALVVPKVDSPDEVHWILDRVKSLVSSGRPRPLASDSGSKTSGGQQHWQRPMAFIPMCESALSLLNLRQTFEAAKSHPAASMLHLQACILGGDDFAASIGATRTPDNSELAPARGIFLLTCRAMQVQAIDIVKIDLSDAGMRALLDEAKAAALAGWSGKQVIHPKQVGMVQAAFSPSKAEVEAAMKLVAAFKDHQDKGHGAFVYQGRMIDAPTVLQARNVLALAERLEHMN